MFDNIGIVIAVQSLSRVSHFGPHALQQARLLYPPLSPYYVLIISLLSPYYVLKSMSTESVMLSNHLTLCHPLLLLPSVFPNES